MANDISVGILLFPSITQLDLTGPAEVFARAPGVQLHLVWKNLDPVRTSAGWKIVPTTTFVDAPQFDVLCVPGGAGQIDLMNDEQVLGFLKRQAAGARYVTSVCTGSLLLGAAGLLIGYRATCHWMSLDQLVLLGATPVRERIVRDRNRITGGGVTAGIDFGLAMVAELCGKDAAKDIQLDMEYAPDPPFSDGSPEDADSEVINRSLSKAELRQSRRLASTQAAAERLRGRLSSQGKKQLEVPYNLISEGHNTIRLANIDSLRLYTQREFKTKAVSVSLSFWNSTVVEAIKYRMDESIGRRLTSAMHRANTNCRLYGLSKANDVSIATEVLFDGQLFKPNENFLSRPDLYRKIRTLANDGQTLRLALPLFSRKPVSPLKNRGHFPDLAEIGSLARCYEIAKLLSSIYATGVELNIYADGGKYGRACGTPSAMIRDYQDGLAYWADKLEIGRNVHILDYELELLRVLGPAGMEEREADYEATVASLGAQFDRMFNADDLSASLSSIEDSSVLGKQLGYTFRYILSSVFYQTDKLGNALRNHDDEAETSYRTYIRGLEANRDSVVQWREPFIDSSVREMRGEGWRAAKRYVAISTTDRSLDQWKLLNSNGLKLTIHGKAGEIQLIPTSSEYISVTAQHSVGGLKQSRRGLKLTYQSRIEQEGSGGVPLLLTTVANKEDLVIHKMAEIEQPICYLDRSMKDVVDALQDSVAHE